MDLLTATILAAIGMFAGLVGGMLGVGGSIVMIPAMTELLGPDQHLYQAAALIVNFFVAAPAVYQHRRAKAIEAKTVVRVVPLAAAAAFAGVAISELPVFAGRGEAYLRGLFGLFLLLVAATDLYRLLRPNGSQNTSGGEVPSTGNGRVDSGSAVTWTRAAAVAIPTGIVSGLLGVGGGVMAVPLQRRLLNIPIRTAIANSAAIIIATSIVGAIAKNYAFLTKHDYTISPLLLAAVLIPTAIIGSLNGSKLTHRLPIRAVKTAFLILLIVAAGRLMHGAYGNLRLPDEGVATTGWVHPEKGGRNCRGWHGQAPACPWNRPTRANKFAHATPNGMYPSRPGNSCARAPVVCPYDSADRDKLIQLLGAQPPIPIQG